MHPYLRLSLAALLTATSTAAPMQVTPDGQSSGGNPSNGGAAWAPFDYDGPDFSFSGWEGRAGEPPAVDPSTHTLFDVSSFGALPDDGLSDRLAIQAAIDAAQQHPGPAMVFFPPGRFVLRGVDEVGAPPIRVSRSEVVLQGSGMHSGGTELWVRSESWEQPALLFAPDIEDVPYWGGGLLTRLTEIPSRGQREVQVEDASGIEAGDVVRLTAALPDNLTDFSAYFEGLPDDALIQEFFENTSGGGAPWRCDFNSTLKVESVAGNTVRFCEPLQADYAYVSPTYQNGPRLVRVLRPGDELMRDVGLEDLAFVSNYRDSFKHFFNRAADGYNFVELQHLEHSWARRLRMRSGTRGLMFQESGRHNVVYDVLFEGNSGHYSISTVGNYYGNQASFLREVAPVHHGFGATQSAFSSVYHRCNQFAGPEGHSGYPQATLYDCNEGDLSHHRTGGSAPHQAKFTVFWNWSQELFVPGHQGLRRSSDGRYLDAQLSPASVDFWPAFFVLPYVVGLHGVPLEVRDADVDLALLGSAGRKVQPESLFEQQLADRLGETPAWLRQRSESFEAITRTTRVDIGAPANDRQILEGSEVLVEPRWHPRFDLDQLARVDLLAARGHDLDVPESVVASSQDPLVDALPWTPTALGAWRLRLRLTNGLGEEVHSEPHYTLVRPAASERLYYDAVDAWLQPRSLDARTIYNASNDVPYVDLDSYHAAVRAIEDPLVRPAVEDPTNRAVALGLIDGDLTTSASDGAALRWFGIKGLVFDLGSELPISFIELVAPGDHVGVDHFAQMDVQLSSRPEAELSYTNSDFSWRTVRRFGHARTAGRLPMGNNRRYRVTLPDGSQGRYVRLCIQILDSAGPQSGNLAEVRFGTFGPTER